MWLKSSSIGKKLIMSVTGACLILFVTFHVLMNSVAILWPAAYNSICAFLGANWYALIACAGLALLFVAHIVYAFILTIQNRKARGADRYAVTSTPKSVEWSSKNMLVLGIVVIAFMAVHLIQFWYKMQCQEILGHHFYELENGVLLPVTAGTAFIQLAFQEWWTLVVYLVGFAALWLHMNHGFWSMFQSAGWNNTTWLPRLKKISCAWTTIVIGLFVIQAGWFTYQANQGEYFKNKELKAQYQEMVVEVFQAKEKAIQQNAESQYDPAVMQQMEALKQEFMETMQKINNLDKVAEPVEENALDEKVDDAKVEADAAVNEVKNDTTAKN